MKILLLAGGDSSEREVSLNSSVAIWQSLVRLGHVVTCLDPSTGGYLTMEDNRLLAIQSEASPPPGGSLLPLATGVLGVQPGRGLPEADLVFLGLHGGSGENGSIQNLLDLAGLAYTGSGTTASVVAMDKADQ